MLKICTENAEGKGGCASWIHCPSSKKDSFSAADIEPREKRANIVKLGGFHRVSRARVRQYVRLGKK